MRARKNRLWPLLEMLESRRLFSVVADPADTISASEFTTATPVQAAAAAAEVSATLDTVVFGNSASESSHGFASTNSQAIAGALSQSARQLLPRSPAQVNGGDMTFTLAVDPLKRNYFTVKLWGSDDTDASKGRLYLYVPLNGTDYQVGYRHEGDYTPLSVTADKRPLPGRFFYSTTMLPLSMTRGKTSLTLKIVSTGELYGLGSGGPPGGNYQFNMTVASRGIYRAYTHTQALLDVTGETQGTAPITTTRPAVSESSILGPTGTFTTGLNNWINGRLGAAITNFSATDVEMLARSHSVSQLSAGYQNAAVVNKVIAVIDGFAADYFANPATSTNTNTYAKDGGNEVWGGRFGALGWAITLLASQLQGSLDTVVNYGAAGGDKTRRQAWGDMLTASRDWGRFNRDSRYLTNQSLIADSHIYHANRGLIALGDARAFSESAAQRYLEESIGLLPWLGSDLAGGGSSLKYGTDYYQVTAKGLTREWGYAGGYGEMASYAAHFYDWTGNVAFKEQAVKMLKAMANFRRSAIEISGASNYRSMERVGLLAWRGVREADGYFANDIAYGDGVGFAGGMRVAGVTLDPAAVGYAKQMLADNQFLAHLTDDARYYSSLTFDSRFVMEVYDDYNAVKNAADSGIRLPMTAGQPDFAWSDEDSGIAVIKRGNERLWVEPYWQAKDGTGVNGIARFYFSTPTYEQYGVLETNPQFTSSGAYLVRANMVDMTEQTRYQPPDNPSNAYAGEKLPTAAAPGDSKHDDPFRGKADFYAFRYGNYLFGINRSASESYELKTPIGFTSAPDLSSGATKSGTVTVAPGSSVVLYLSSSADPAPVPTAPLFVQASGSPTQVSLEWSAASGATGYTVKRSTTEDGVYTAVASDVTTTAFTDPNVTRGVTYYYVISASNENGESYDSSQTSASAGLPAPWASQDIGAAIALSGNGSVTAGAFTVRGSASPAGSGIGGAADSSHFTYLPVSGNVTIAARVTGMWDSSGSDRSGVMIRESLAADSGMAAVLFEDSGNVRLTRRTSTGGSAATSGSISGAWAPGWIKLERAGSTFRAYLSTDGVNWGNAFTTQSITMNANVYVGLAVASNSAAEMNVSTFDNVQVVTTNSAPTVATPAAASPNPVTGAEMRTNLNVLGADAGGEANLTYTWTTAGTPLAPVEFSVNGTNSSKNTVATFAQPGTYDFLVTITDFGGAGLNTTSSVTVNVSPSTFTGTPAADQWVVRRSGGHLLLWVGDGSGPATYTLAYADVTSFTFIGDGGDDRLTIDSTDGHAVPTGGVTFDGGGGDDTMLLRHPVPTSAEQLNFLGGDGAQELTVDGGALTLGSDVAATAGRVSLNLLNAAAVTLHVDQQLTAVGIAAGARLDVRDHRLILTGMAAGTATSGTYDGVQGLVQSGYTYGEWSGSGIVTTMPDAAADRGVTTLAVATAAQVLFLADGETALWGGRTVSASDTLLMYTYAGDLNFDGLVDGADYGVIDNYYQFPGTTGYANGDFNFDGLIDGADYGLIDNSIQLQGLPL